jgi:selenocysteine-specific elongation factor
VNGEELFSPLIDGLCGTDFLNIGAAIRRADHRPSLPVEFPEIAGQLRDALSRKPFDPPSRKELSADPAWQQVLRFFLETGEVVEIDAEVVMLSENLKQATQLILQFIRENGPATASGLRQAIGSSRRVIIPLLERLDRTGVTERKGDRRALRGIQSVPKSQPPRI